MACAAMQRRAQHQPSTASEKREERRREGGKERSRSCSHSPESLLPPLFALFPASVCLCLRVASSLASWPALLMAGEREKERKGKRERECNECQCRAPHRTSSRSSLRSADTAAAAVAADTAFATAFPCNRILCCEQHTCCERVSGERRSLRCAL